MIVRVSILFLLLLTSLFAGDVASTEDKSDFFQFLGRFHPMILHFPIGIINILVLLEIYIWFRKADHLKAAAWILLVVGAITAIKAAGLGYLLAWGKEDDYDPDLLFWHKWLGISVAVLSILAVYLRWQNHKKPEQKGLMPYRLVLVLCVSLMGLAGHDGGSLTHGKNYLFKYAPQWVLDLFGIERGGTTPIGDNLVFNTVVWPAFEGKCISCHGPDKQKGKYRLDNKADAFKGGESELVAIVPGNPMKSYLVELIQLPAHAEEVMPPEGKKALTEKEILAISQWVYDGAKWPETTKVSTAAGKTEDPKKTEDKPTVKPEAAKPAPTPAKAAPVKPEPVKKAYVAPKPGETVDFVKHILPILEDRCFSCHGPKKQKGDLRLDSPKHIATGGETGDKIIIPGEPDKSSFYTLTTLPEDDDDIMPPKKGPLTKDQQNAIRDWIAQGAKYGSWAPNPN